MSIWSRSLGETRDVKGKYGNRLEAVAHQRIQEFSARACVCVEAEA